MNIPEGAIAATVDVSTGTTAGTATITAAAPGFIGSTAVVDVSLRAMALTSPGPLVGVGHTLPGTVTLAQPAPAGGVTITLTSGDSSLVSVPSSVFIAEGDQTASFTITGVAIGVTTISASGDGFATATLPITSTASALITLGSGAVAPGLDTSLALSIGIQAPAGGVTIALSSSDPSIASVVTPTVFIPAGLQIPAANPVIHGVAIGIAQITATTATLAPDTAPVTVTVSTSFAPNPFTVIEGHTEDITLTLSSPAPAGGMTFNTSTDNAALASVPPTARIDAGSTSVLVPVTGVAVGSTVVRASAPGAVNAAATVVVNPAPPINIGDATIGQNLQVTLSGSLGAAAPAGNLQVTVTSPDPTRVLLATSDSAVGTASISLQVGAGQTTIPTFYVQALAGIGTVTLQTTAPGYAADTSLITLTPSGFTFPNGTGNISTTTFSNNTSLGVVAARLNPDLSYAQGQQIRGGLLVSVPIVSSDPIVGVMVDASNSQVLVDHLDFSGGDSSASVAFDPKEVGTTTISLATPAGFSTPSALRQITATVTGPPISIGDATIGQNLQTTLSGNLGAPAPAGNVQVTITSPDPTRVLLATTDTAVGTASITLQVGAGQSAIPPFYVQALAGTGTVTLQTTASGYAADASLITLTPSGFTFPNGTSNFTTTALSTNSVLSVVTAQLNPTTLNYAASQPLRAGYPTVNVTVTSSLPSVGAVVNSPAVFNAGDSGQSVQFDPVAGGATTLSVEAPAGFATPNNFRQITATVTAVPISIGDATIGQDLQVSLSGGLGAPAPAGNVQVTVTSPDPTRVLLATGATAVGTASITLDVGAGQSAIPTFYVQALAGTGTVTLQTTAPGYTADTSLITLTPSGFTFQNGTSNFTTTTFANNSTLGVVSAQLNPTTLNYAANQPLRAGYPTVSVAVTSSLPSVGAIVNSPAVFSAGDSGQTVQFDPAAGGTTTLSLVPPAGFTTPNNLQQITGTVTAPNISVSGTGVVGLDLQTSISVTLGASPPSRLDVTLTSNNPAIATITTTPTITGGSTVTFTNVPVTLPGTTVGTFYVQGRSLGTTTITVQAPGYNNATLNVTVNPSGFTFQNGTNNFSTTTFSANTTLGIVSALLDPTTHNYASNQPLRGGYPNVTVDVTSTNPSVGTIVNSPVVFTGGGASGQTVQFDPAAAGTTTLSLVPPAGFTTPSNLQQATATVTAPNISVSGTGVVGLDLQTSISVTLGASPPSRRDVTLTSNNPGDCHHHDGPAGCRRGDADLYQRAGDPAGHDGGDVLRAGAQPRHDDDHGAGAGL